MSRTPNLELKALVEMSKGAVHIWFMQRNTGKAVENWFKASVNMYRKWKTLASTRKACGNYA